MLKMMNSFDAQSQDSLDISVPLLARNLRLRLLLSSVAYTAYTLTVGCL